MQNALKQQKSTVAGKPKALIAKTLKGRGVPGLENAPLSHIINPKPELVDKLIDKSIDNLLEERA